MSEKTKKNHKFLWFPYDFLVIFLWFSYSQRNPEVRQPKDLWNLIITNQMIEISNQVNHAPQQYDS